MALCRLKHKWMIPLLFVVILFSAMQVRAASLSSKKITLAYGARKVIKVKGSSKKAAWSISNKEVAVLTSKKAHSAAVVPKHAGSTVVTCKVGGKTLTCKVTVLNSAWETSADEISKIGFAFPKKKNSVLVCKEGVHFQYNKSIIRVVTAKNDWASTDRDTFPVDVLVIGKKTGTTTLRLSWSNGDSYSMKIISVPGMRKSGSSSKKAYRSWRKKFIKTVLQKDVSTYQFINALCGIIGCQHYGYKGNGTGYDLWKTGYATCVGGARMVCDFMTDLGIPNKFHFAGKDSPLYGKQHYNCHIKINGKKHVIDAQPYH